MKKTSDFDEMKNKMDSLKNNGTYEPVKLSKGNLRNKWVFKYKKKGEKIMKRNAKLVVKECNQKKGVV